MFDVGTNYNHDSLYTIALSLYITTKDVGEEKYYCFREYLLSLSIFLFCQ